jgi:hypothetical protein
MSKSQLGLYTFDAAATGLCLWSADPITTSRRRGFIRGPVIYQDYVVVGTGIGITERSLKI